jgi:putative phage-type endonuclease
MSFGEINTLLNKTIKYLGEKIKKNNLLTPSELIIIRKQIYEYLLNEHIEITLDIVDEILNRVFSTNYKFSKTINFSGGVNCFREFEDKYPEIKVPLKYKKLNEHFEKLKNLPQPAQRTKEWFDYRHNRITASDTATAINLNPYEPVESFILKKCDPNYLFKDNKNVFHGKKYEPIATMIYEHVYNVRVFEFGALPSNKYSLLGASPDGICSKYTLDNKFSDRLGTMLEIKCPVSRFIQINGDVIGKICPFYYYCQVQQQLVCCELDVCDFWQCKITEYKNRDDYINDDCDNNNITFTDLETNRPLILNVSNKIKKGIILEFYPKNFVAEFEDDNIEWKSKYIIPKRLDMSEEQYDSWLIKMLDQYKELYPELKNDYYFHKIIYWKLDLGHNVSIYRDDKFMNNIIPILYKTWDKILYYRNNYDKLDELKPIIIKKKKYVKINTNYKIHNNIIMEKNYLFLDSLFDLNNILNSVYKYNINNECDFID